MDWVPVNFLGKPILFPTSGKRIIRFRITKNRTWDASYEYQNEIFHDKSVTERASTDAIFDYLKTRKRFKNEDDLEFKKRCMRGRYIFMNEYFPDKKMWRTVWD